MSYDATKNIRTLNEYLQTALKEFNKKDNGEKQDWYGWEKLDNLGNKIPNEDRMQHQYVKSIIEGSVIPSKANLDAKMLELRNADIASLNADNAKALSGKAKLKALGLDDDEIAQMYP